MQRAFSPEKAHLLYYVTEKAADELSKADWSMLKDTVRLLISAGVGVVRDEKEK